MLYDECGCDDDRCLPNRILESYRIDAVLDPPAEAAAWTGPTLTRVTDIAVAGARRVVVLDDGALAVADETAVHHVDETRHRHRQRGSRDQIHGLDVAAGGSLYVTR